jgi:2-polyprenyl-6-methoxyphenol hydroxylase-like FAD-dependent oxidoreductase
VPPGGIAAAEPEPDAPGLDAEVLVVGAGPVGCWLAAELAAAGVRVLVIEARESRAAWSRGFVVHPRTLEIFDSRGVAQQLLEDGRALPTWHFAMGPRRLDFSTLPTTFPFTLLQPQARTEELIEQHLNRHGGTVSRGRRAVGLTQYPDHVAVRVLHDGAEHTLTARFVVGCDGSRSTVRQSAGIGFSGSPDTISSPHALVELAAPPPPEQYMQTRENGAFFAIALPDGRFVVSTIDHAAMHEVQTPWTAETVRASVVRITGTDYGMGEPERISVLGNSARQAHRYRDRRVLLAGDAAHVHYPMGGQGMNLGVQDAHNLAWRLAFAVRAERGRPGGAKLPDLLLDGYEAERRPVGERVLEDVRAQLALVAARGADGVALRSRFEALLSEHPQVHREYALRLSGLSVRYPQPGEADGDSRLGARVPDLLLELPAEGEGAGAAGGTRLYDLLAAIGPARFVRLSVSDGPRAEAEDDPDEQDEQAVEITARAVLGPPWALRAGWGRAETVLIRPDGHIADIGARAAAP